MVGAKPPRLLVRLDDGSVIGNDLLGEGTGPARVSVEQGQAVGLASEKEATRLSSLLATARELVAKTAPPPQPLSSGGPSKRPRIDSGHLLDGLKLVGDWETKCKTMLGQMSKTCGVWKNLMWMPVDPGEYPDYYKVITQPMFFQQIEERLANRTYASHDDFYRDMKLAFFNIFKYNPPENQCGKLGSMLESEFDNMWMVSRLADPELLDARGKRKTAGVAPPKYEPLPLQSPSQGQTRSKAHRSAAHEATSRGGSASKDQPVSNKRKVEIMELLQSEVMADHMEALVEVLPKEMLETADGELELDFESMDDATLRRIDQFLQNLFGPPKPSAGNTGGVDDNDMSEDMPDDIDSDDD